MTHADLVKVAARWLRSVGCSAVFTELCAADEIPDAIGWKHGTHSLVVECKVSKSDFYADKQKPFRKNPDRGMGYRRFYLVPKGLLKAEDVGDWGLLETVGKKVSMVKTSQAFMTRNFKDEMRILVSALRRIQLRIDQPLDTAIKWGTGYHSVPLLEEPLADTQPDLGYL